MSGNTRKFQVTRLVTLRHRSTMSGALGHAPQCRMRGRLWILPPDALVIQSGGPLEASAGHGARTPSRSAKAHGAGSEVRTAAGCRLRFSAAARTQAPERPRLAGGYKVSFFCRK
jgi:hypothetical protein